MILVGGQAIYDFFQQSEKGAAVTFAARPGGAPFNVAVALARMGAPTAFCGAFSTDAMGERLMAALHAEGIDAAFAKRTSCPTALAVVGTNALGTPAFSFYGEHPAHCDLTPADLPTPGTRYDAIYVGCFPLVQEPVGSTLLQLITRERNATVIAYDPNVRLSIESDIDLWRARFADFSAHADIVKISSEDFAALFPGKSPETLAGDLMAHGAALMLYTDGEKGMHVLGRHHDARFTPPPVIVQDTVGAGDTAMAAALCWLREKNFLHKESLAALGKADLKALAAFACHAAAITCTRIGADPPTRAQIPD